MAGTLERGRGSAAIADARFLVVGEELSLPMDLLAQNRLDALWNDKFREYIRAALLGQNADNENFESTVRKAIDCRQFGFSDGAQAVNYLTSHDVEGFRKERLWTFFDRSGVGHRAKKEADQAGVRLPADRRRHPDDSGRRGVRR